MSLVTQAVSLLVVYVVMNTMNDENFVVAHGTGLTRLWKLM